MRKSLAKKHYSNYVDRFNEINALDMDDERKTTALTYLEQTINLMVQIDILAVLEDLKNSVTELTHVKKI